MLWNTAQGLRLWQVLWNDLSDWKWKFEEYMFKLEGEMKENWIKFMSVFIMKDSGDQITENEMGGACGM